MLKYLSDEALAEMIADARHTLERVKPAGDCIGRRCAAARLDELEAEMIRRYEVELTWGAA